MIAVGTGAITNARELSRAWEKTAAGEDRPAAAAGAGQGKRPALFSDEALARLPVRRVPARKG